MSQVLHESGDSKIAERLFYSEWSGLPGILTAFEQWDSKEGSEGLTAWIFRLQISWTWKQSSSKACKVSVDSSFYRKTLANHLCKSWGLGICHLASNELNRSYWLQLDPSEMNGEVKFLFCHLLRLLDLCQSFTWKWVFILLCPES